MCRRRKNTRFIRYTFLSFEVIFIRIFVMCMSVARVKILSKTVEKLKKKKLPEM